MPRCCPCLRRLGLLHRQGFIRAAMAVALKPGLLQPRPTVSAAMHVTWCGVLACVVCVGIVFSGTLCEEGPTSSRPTATEAWTHTGSVMITSRVRASAHS